MSRSYRKPYWTDGYGTKGRKERKRDANRAVRRTDVASGKAYRKVFNSWDIRDWSFLETDKDRLWKIRRK